MFFKIGAFKNFVNFTEKQRPRGLQPFLKKTPTQVFSCEICEIFKNTFFYRTPPAAASED